MTATSPTGPRAGPAARPERFRFELPARLEFRDAARAFLAHVCDHLTREGRLPADAGHRVISAFVEAFNNCVIHAYRDMTPGPVEVELEVADASLSVSVIDHGQTFAPEDVPKPNLAALPEGGLGLFIIRNFMDHVSYTREGTKNVLTMVKRFDGSATEPEPSSEGAPIG